jgi:uncharacterized peroxidase-related enzyme
MPHIDIPDDLPGIGGLMAFRPETARVLSEFVDILLRQRNSLETGERELIASYVSWLNECVYCHTIHGAIATHDFGCDEDLMNQVKQDYQSAPISDKLKALLTVAIKVCQGGKNVSRDDIIHARRLGITDKEIHDTVLIAAAFCMFSRYVDGLATIAPHDPDFYRIRAEQIATDGYSTANKGLQSGRARPVAI